MPFVKIKGATAKFAKPRDWNEKEAGPCGDLWIRFDRYGPYLQHNFAWKPDAEQLKLLNAGGAIEVHIINEYMPPVGVSVVYDPEAKATSDTPPRPSSPPTHHPVG